MERPLFDRPRSCESWTLPSWTSGQKAQIGSDGRMRRVAMIMEWLSWGVWTFLDLFHLFWVTFFEWWVEKMWKERSAPLPLTVFERNFKVVSHREDISSLFAFLWDRLHEHAAVHRLLKSVPIWTKLALEAVLLKDYGQMRLNYGNS